jgi:uncharacterized protein YecE (DUF72 family)
VTAEIRIGTSGWQYKHWRGTFYPPKTTSAAMLAAYTARLDTVEVNNSFYRLPSAAALDRWRDATPGDFCFAVKGSRFLTHMKKLKDPDAGLGRFMPLVERLADKLGPILFQLPPRWGPDLERFERFLEALPREHRYAFELRDERWHSREVYRLLERRGAAFCIYEIAGRRSPREITADFTYVRLHGPTDKAYEGSYSNRELGAWARQIEDWRRTLKAVYVYFDNDDSGYAPRNALELSGLVERKKAA